MGIAGREIGRKIQADSLVRSSFRHSGPTSPPHVRWTWSHSSGRFSTSTSHGTCHVGTFPFTVVGHSGMSRNALLRNVTVPMLARVAARERSRSGGSIHARPLRACALTTPAGPRHRSRNLVGHQADRFLGSTAPAHPYVADICTDLATLAGDPSFAGARQHERHHAECFPARHVHAHRCLGRIGNATHAHQHTWWIANGRAGLLWCWW